MARRYIGGVGNRYPSAFKKSNNPGDYTTEDVTVKKGHVIPKGTYIGVGAVNDDFIKLLPDDLKDNAQSVLYDLRVKGSTNWYENNEDKFNYGYKDPETFIKDTYARYSEHIDSGYETMQELLDYQKYEDPAGRNVISSDAGEASALMEFTPDFIVPPKGIDKVEPKKATKINVEEPEVNMQPLPELQGGVGSSNMDDFFNRLETAKIYENRPDRDSKGRKVVRTQYVFSDDNPFKPKGRYFMGEANTKGKRKTSGDLIKAREWERKFGLGIQKDIKGYIPSLEFGGAGKTAPFKQNDDFFPDPNRSVSGQVKEKQEQDERDKTLEKQKLEDLEEIYNIDPVDFADAVAMTGVPVVSEAADLVSAGISAGRGDYTAASLSLAGALMPFAGGRVLKEGAKQIPKFTSKTEMADRINLAMKNNDWKVIDTDPRFTSEMKAELVKSSKNLKSLRNQHALDYGQRFLGNKSPKQALKDMKNLGYKLDKSGFDPTKLTSKDVKYIGSSSGRTIVEVKLPNGEKQLFYKSGGTAGKKGEGVGGTTEGLWQPYAGNDKNGWFVKDGVDSKSGKLFNDTDAPAYEGYENYYNSASYRGIANKLNELEGGFDMSEQVLKSQQ